MSKLFIVPTPLGNLGDITLRALEVLKSVDVIFSEDTRNTLKLLNHFNIKKKILSYHKDNEEKSSENIILHLKRGETVALVSDAGTPCISDPGQIVVKKLLDHGITLEVLPGATAFVPAVIKSGFPTDKIFFCGFLPKKNKERTEFLDYLKNNVFATIVFYEAPHRIKETIKEILALFTPPISVSRELTKIYETTYFVSNDNDLNEIVEKGEFVIVINNNYEEHKSDDLNIEHTVEKLKEEGFSNQEILKVLKVLGVKRNIAYDIVLGKR